MKKLKQGDYPEWFFAWSTGSAYITTICGWTISDAKQAMEKQDILDMVKYARHIHVAGDGENIDTCKKCGHDIHHGIHLRYGENINEYTESKFSEDKTV